MRVLLSSKYQPCDVILRTYSTVNFAIPVISAYVPYMKYESAGIQ